MDGGGKTVADRLLEEISRGIHIYDLGHSMFTHMPQSPAHPAFQMSVARRHGDVVRDDGSSGANEVIVTGGHVGTHIDALAHISYDGRLHGGIEVTGIIEQGRFKELGIETVAPIVRRGVLFDIARTLGVDRCDAGYEVTVDDLELARRRAGVTPEPGDVILLSTGWGQLYDDALAWQGDATGIPGPSEPGARWLAQFRPHAVGSDTVAFECLPGGLGYGLPAHRFLIVERGIHIIEALDLEQLAAAQVREFTFVLSPLKIVGATGSPARPLAIVSA